MTRKLLMIPGPSEADPEVLPVLAKQVVAHYGDDFYKTYLDISNKLKQVFKTKNDTILLPAPGSAAGLRRLSRRPVSHLPRRRCNLTVRGAGDCGVVSAVDGITGAAPAPLDPGRRVAAQRSAAARPVFKVGQLPDVPFNDFNTGDEVFQVADGNVDVRPQGRPFIAYPALRIDLLREPVSGSDLVTGKLVGLKFLQPGLQR